MKSNKVLQKDKLFPPQLLTLAQVPKALYTRGADLADILSTPMVAIVGSRKVSGYGRIVTTRLAGNLARAGITIVSGLALGVDSIAHTAALDAGGRTIAILPCGIDTIYPSTHYPLAKRILQNDGVLISEYDGIETPMKHNFIARNRIIAGVSQGVLITEAAAKSGSLHTANFALEQGIEVFAIPGNITSLTSEGTNSLIKSGATPVTSAQDIIEALGFQSVKRDTTAALDDPHQQTIASLIEQGITDPTELQIMSHLPLADYNQAITLLELAGIIYQPTPNQWLLQ